MSEAEVTDERLTRLMAITSCDAQQARFLLDASQGNMQLAIQMFYEQVPGSVGPQQQGVPTYPATQQFPPPPRPRAPLAGMQPQRAAVAQNNATGLAGTAVRLPFALLRTGFGLLSTVITFSVTVAAYVGDRTLPRPVMRGIRGAVKVVTGHVEELDPASQAQQFIQQYKTAYGDRHPRFLEAGLRQATSQARNDHRFLFVYLHSPEHQDTDRFCTEVLSAPELVEFVNNNFTCWGGDIRQPDAYLLSGRLGVTSYPYAALLYTEMDNRMQLVTAVQGLSTAGHLLTTLVRVVEEQGGLLMAQRVVEIDRQLRQQQNDEYEASLAADREREANLQEERRKAQAERQAAAEAEARARAEEEAEERRAADLAASIQQRREQKRAALGPEVAPGSACALVRVRLPDGSNSQRRFREVDTLQHLFDFVDSLDATTFWRYNLVSTYPKRIFGLEAVHETLKDAGLTPHANLFVQPEEDT